MTRVMLRGTKGGGEPMAKRRLPKFEEIWIKEDARYFKETGYISDDMYRRVLAWLEGGEDQEAQETVAQWMEKDAAWMDRVEPYALRHFWYLTPAVKIGSVIWRRHLKKRVRELRVSAR
jgi:hypothetical protein